MYSFSAELQTDNILTIDTNIERYHIDDYDVYSIDAISQSDADIYEVVKSHHCVALRHDANSIQLLNDPFGTIPLFIYCKNSKLIVDTQFEQFRSLELTIDKAGCYEQLMYASGLFDRTAFNEIKQMPAASVVTYNLDTCEIKIDSYWDYAIKCSGGIRAGDAIDKVWSVLSNTFRQYRGKDVLMGMSGGLDSRLSLCLLKEEADVYSIETFTFGHNKGVRDYKYASLICDELGVDRPRFFRLAKDAYRSGLVLPGKTGGCVGVAHSHSWYCINQLDVVDKVLISNYYSDGVMGYDCRPTDVGRKEDSDYYKILYANEWNASSEVLDEIRADLDEVCDRRSDHDNYSGYNEYIYLTERNPKFHMRLSYLYSELMPVEMPFADYQLLQAVISLPKKLRYYKKIEHLILSKKLGDYQDISSTRYAGLDQEEERIIDKFRFNAGFVAMLSINRVNAGLKLLSNGAIQIPNPYITENHSVAFDRYFADKKLVANEKLGDWLGINISNNPLERKNNIRTADAERGFNLVGLYELLNEYL